jgi:sialate O-acetylesterase
MKIPVNYLLRVIVALLILNVMSENTFAQIRMPRIFSDHMVLQRDAGLKVWGWASAGERVTVSIDKQKKTARADRNGNWSVLLDPMNVGGPLEMVIKGKNTIIFKDILIGDVWLGSGQSNMEWPVRLSANAQEEIQQAGYPGIRIFTVPRHMSSKPVDDLESGQWLECTPENVAAFSAVGYYFARHLHNELDVPIGIINSSWGGTVAETWISAGTMRKHDDFKEIMLKENEFSLETLQEQAQEKMQAWLNDVDQKDLGLQESWEQADLDDSQWELISLPGRWETSGQLDLVALDGSVWFRREFILNEQQATIPLTLNLGYIDDSDYTFINGTLVGSTIDRYNAKRSYHVPSGLLKTGRNVIAVRVLDTGGGGGIWGHDSLMYYTSGMQKKSLQGTWKYAIGFRSERAPQSTLSPNVFPSLLYNGMIHPIQSYAIRGVIWYQGESNVGRAQQYRRLFASLINDWRQKWANPQMPVLFVQLANFMQSDKTPRQSAWAELREAQASVLNMPHTAMAVAIDIGEADDIHPQNKQDVGRRLALAALEVSYGKNNVFTGPVFQSMKIEDNRIRLAFDEGQVLFCKDKYGYLKGFAIAGEDKIFRWARAYLVDNQVIVYSNTIDEPVAVRYAWGDNPDDANLYNIEGLPAAPFRTDDW